MFGDMWQQLVDFQEKLANTTFESKALEDLKDILEETVGYIEDLSSYWDIFSDKLDNIDGITLLQALLAGIDAATFNIRTTIKETISLFEWLLGKAGELYQKGKNLVGDLFSKDNDGWFGGIFNKKDKEVSDSNEEKTPLKLPKLTLPAVANPAVSKAMSMMKQHNEIEQDNSLKSEVNVTVYGTDPNSTATATAKELEAIMLRLMTPWSAARIKTIPTS